MTDARVSAATVEALTDGTPQRLVSVSSVEALTNAAPAARRVSALRVEVLTPAALVVPPATSSRFFPFFA